MEELTQRHIDTALEAVLGFDRVRQTIADRCNTDYAAQKTLSETFSTDEAVIRSRLLLTDEMRLVLMFEEAYPVSGYVDCTHFLRVLLSEGANIDQLNLGKLRTLLDTTAKICAFFLSVKDGVYPNLTAFTKGLTVFPDVRRRIDVILDKYGNIRDSASPALEEIRRTLKDKEGAVSKRIQSILRRAQDSGFADSDAAVVVRDGRMLLPIISAHKRKIAGVVYDESASGKTSFIQPVEIVEIENEIARLHTAETIEIARILSEFSDFVRPFVPDILAGAICLCELDFLMAKAAVALDYIAGMPLISREGEMSLRKARHPLLEKTLSREGRKIVPLTVTLTPAKHILLISGPNAGGKSVCLKTTGLLQYMFQWGMLIPTSETSEMMVFDRIMVNIGDGQSIDNDLSTYSAFLKGMGSMLSEATSRTLVLIDEFGSGTDPAAGGAIAEAILSELDKRGVYGVITTHYTNLKLYASNRDSGVVNGAMLFDATNIEPLFKLEIGLPGNSFAFELARKMGLPEAVVKDAEQRAGDEFVGIERNLRKIARNRKALDEKLQRIRNTDKTLENITDKYRKELEEIRKTRQKILSDAHQEAENIIKEANRKVENTIRTIQETKADKEKTKQARDDLRGFVDALSRHKQRQQQEKEDYLDSKIARLEERKRKENERRRHRAGESAEDVTDGQLVASRKEAEPLKLGEKVRIKDSGLVGEISSISGRNATVIIGNISSKVNVQRLERISSNEFKAASKTTETKWTYKREDPAIAERKANFKTEIDVRGERVDDALKTVVSYIDDAIMLGVPSVRIVHGKGTGALREEIQKYLRTCGGIRQVRDENIRLGGTGVTVVEFE